MWEIILVLEINLCFGKSIFYFGNKIKTLQNPEPQLVTILHNDSHDLKSFIGGVASKVHINNSPDKMLLCVWHARMQSASISLQLSWVQINITSQKYVYIFWRIVGIL